MRGFHRAQHSPSHPLPTPSLARIDTKSKRLKDCRARSNCTQCHITCIMELMLFNDINGLGYSACSATCRFVLCSRYVAHCAHWPGLEPSAGQARIERIGQNVQCARCTMTWCDCALQSVLSIQSGRFVQSVD